ncbi:UNVERIFIED_CONTAM: hypothetical protein LBW93_03995 [Wolbachia endosymbiont of Nasonia longicornis]
MPILQQNALVTIYLKAFLLTITSINTSYATKPFRSIQIPIMPEPILTSPYARTHKFFIMLVFVITCSKTLFECIYLRIFTNRKFNRILNFCT